MSADPPEITSCRWLFVFPPFFALFSAPPGRTWPIALLSAPPSAQISDSITLPSLEVAVPEVPFPMSAADYQALSTALAQFEDALTKKSEPAPE